MATYVLDGYNIVRSKHFEMGGTSRSDAAPHDLLILLKSFVRKHHNDKFILVFDGTGNEVQSYPGIKIRFSGSETADEEILRLTATEGDRFIVVSDDRQVRSGARINECQVLPVEGFLAMVMPKVKPKTAKTTRDSKQIPYPVVSSIQKELSDYYEKKKRAGGGFRKP